MNRSEKEVSKRDLAKAWIAGFLGIAAIATAVSLRPQGSLDSMVLTSPVPGSVVTTPIKRLFGTGIPGSLVDVYANNSRVMRINPVPASGKWDIPIQTTVGEYDVEINSLDSSATKVVAESKIYRFTVLEDEAFKKRSLAILNPAPLGPLKAGPLTISGKASPNKGVVISVGNSKQVEVIADNKGIWEAPITIAEGAGKIMARLQGSKSVETLDFVAEQGVKDATNSVVIEQGKKPVVAKDMTAVANSKVIPAPATNISEPKSEPKNSTAPAKIEAKVVTKSEPKVVVAPAPTPQVSPKEQPKSAVKPAPKAEAKPELKVAAKPVPKIVAPKVQPEPGAKVIAKTEAKPPVKVAVKPTPKPASKVVAKLPAKPVAKPAPAPKPDSKPEVKKPAAFAKTVDKPNAIEGSKLVVKKGDSLSRIAARLNVSLASLIKANSSIKNPNLIFAGNTLSIPKKQVEIATGKNQVTAKFGSDSKTSEAKLKAGHTVKKGESLSKIATEYNLNLSSLIKANKGIKNPNLIFTGQKIRLNY